MHGMRHVLEHGQTLRATSVTQIQKSRRCENTIWMELHCFMLVHGGGGGYKQKDRVLRLGLRGQEIVFT